MKFKKNYNKYKPLFILLILVLSHNINSMKEISSLLSSHKKHQKLTFSRANTKSKTHAYSKKLSSSGRNSNNESTFKHLSKRSKYKKSTASGKFHFKSESETSANTKDPVTITIFAIMLAIKITKAILEHYTKKNLNAALTNLQAEREQNTQNAELIQTNEIRTCSAMKLVLTIAKHMYNITYFKMIYTDAYMEYLRVQSRFATCSRKRRQKSKSCIMSQLVEKLKTLKENLSVVFPRMLDNMKDNVRGACEENDLSEELVSRNKAIDSKIEEIEGKIGENEGSILEAIIDGLLNDIEQEKGDFLKIQFNPEIEESDDDPTKTPGFEETYSKVTAHLKLGVDFIQLVKSFKELKQNEDPIAIEWTETIQTGMNFMASVVHVVSSYMNNPILDGVEQIINFIGTLISLFGHIYDYRTEKNEDKKLELKKKLWDKVLEVVFAAGKCIVSPVVEMIEESVNLYRKFQSFKESKVILERSIRDRQMFALKGERLVELSKNFQIYSQCQMRHFTMMQFFHIFKDIINIEANQLLGDQNSQAAWREIVIQGRSTLRIKEQIKSLCDKNIQFCSRTFSENYLKSEVEFSESEFEGMKREAVYGPYSDIAIASDSNQADSYILLGYEPIYSKDSVDQGFIVLGCRRCSKTHAIRYVNIMQFHKNIENHKNLMLDMNLHARIGKCDKSGQVCNQLFNDKQNSATGACRSSKWKSIRVDYRFENGVLGFERVKYSGFTPVLAHLMLFESTVGSTSQLNVTPKYAVWVDAEKTYYDCSTIASHHDQFLKKQFLKSFCQECTSGLYAAPIIADTCLDTDAADVSDDMKTAIFKINETGLSSKSEYFGYIKLNNIKVTAKTVEDCRNSKIGVSNRTDIVYKYAQSDGSNTKIKVNINHTFLFEERNLVKNQHNWLLKYKFEKKKETPIFFSLANTTAKKIEVTCEEFYPEQSSSHSYREEDYFPCGTYLYYMLSFEPFNNKYVSDSENESALSLKEIQNMRQSSTEICHKVCDDSQQDICQYSISKKASLMHKKSGNFKERLDTGFEIGDDSYKIRYSKFTTDGACVNIDYGADHQLIVNSECDKSGSIYRKYVEDEIIIIVESKDNKDEENRKYHLASGFIEWQHPKRYEKFIYVVPETKKKIEYWVRIYVKYDKKEGLLPFNDYFHKIGKTDKVCIDTLVKSNYSEDLWPREFMDEDNKKGKLFGNGLTKIKNPVSDNTQIDVFSFLNKKYSCTKYNLFIPKKFNYDNTEREKLFYKDKQKKIFRKMVKEEDKYQERWSHSGPGLRMIYWVQISNNEDLFYDSKFEETAWEHGYYSLEPIVYEKSKDMEDKTWMRVWVSYNFKLSEDKEKLCRLCLENSK